MVPLLSWSLYYIGPSLSWSLHCSIVLVPLLHWSLYYIGTAYFVVPFRWSSVYYNVFIRITVPFLV
jgi:hypothetical protein